MSNRLPAQNIRLSKYHEWWVYAAMALLVSSGLLWLLFHYFVTVHSDFGAARHPLEALWLKVHGAAAMLALVLFGTMMPVHIRKAWHAGKNRWSGSLLLAVLLLLILTGYVLYYFADEESRPWIGVIHWAIGLGVVPIVILHVIVGQLKHAARASRAIRHTGQRLPDQGPPLPVSAHRSFTPRLVGPAKSRQGETGGAAMQERELPGGSIKSDEG
jgi:hypothetical protein